MIRKGPSDITQHTADIERAQSGVYMPMETEPMYDLPGAQTKQAPRLPGNGIDQYGFKRYYRTDWGLQSGTGIHGSKFAGAYSFFTQSFLVQDDVYAIQVGPNSEAFAVRIYTAQSEQPLVVSALSPLIAPIKGPFWVAPHKTGIFAHKMELITYTRPPVQIFAGRTPLFYQNTAADATIQYAPCYGRRNIRVTIIQGAGANTIQYHQLVTPDQANNYPTTAPGAGANFGGGDVVIAQDNITGVAFTRDTIASPGMFAASGYDIFGVSAGGNYPVMIQIEAFD